MDNFKKVEEIPLNAQDNKLLRLGLAGVIAVPIIFGLFIFFAFSWVSGKTMFAGTWDMQEYAVTAFMSFIVAFCTYLGYQKTADLRTGTKMVYRGTVQDKRKSISQSTSRTGGGGRRNSGSRTKTTVTYIVKLNDLDFKVGLSRYNKVKVGDRVMLSQAPKSKLILDFQVEQSAEKQNDKTLNKKKASYVNRSISKNLTQEDLIVMRAHLRNKINRKLLIVALPLFITISLIYTGWGSLLIFLFPVPLMVLWQVISFTRYYLKYQRAKRDHTKKNITTKVIDQQTVIKNGRILKYTLITEIGKIEVTPDFYNTLPESKIIDIHRIPGLDIVLRTENSL